MICRTIRVLHSHHIMITVPQGLWHYGYDVQQCWQHHCVAKHCATVHSPALQCPNTAQSNQSQASGGDLWLYSPLKCEFDSHALTAKREGRGLAAELALAIRAIFVQLNGVRAVGRQAQLDCRAKISAPAVRLHADCPTSRCVF